MTGKAGKLLAAAIALGAAAGSPSRADSGRPRAAADERAAYDEGYSYLRDPANRSGAWWERLKFVPLDAAGGTWLSVGDEVRLRFQAALRRIEPMLSLPAQTTLWQWLKQRTSSHATIRTMGRFASPRSSASGRCCVL